ncbi:MAG: phosphoenolpyruvate--protein phosphotransferase [Candidatus Marinimicrobia bacterium]|nr:phosphoenolpyruvate--protein phosphotransferase [Candidatus Neomarinimicrobiota bacterium]
MRIIKGRSISQGIAIGNVHWHHSNDLLIPETTIGKEDIEEEMRNLRSALKDCKEELIQTRKLVVRHLDEEHARIIDSQLLILEDSYLQKEVEELIKKEKYNVIKAFNIVISNYEDIISKSNSDYHRQRDLDIQDIRKRVIQHLIKKENYIKQQIIEPSILVSYSISPSDFFTLDPDNVLGIITREGGADSHLAIMAKAFKLPYLSRVQEIDSISEEEFIILDANKGKIILNPVEKTKNLYEDKLENFKSQRNKKIELVDQTKDGTNFNVYVNIEFIKELDALSPESFGGIGLFRTEFLGLERNAFPSEKEQLEVYHRALDKIGDKPIVFRTFDFGRDKFIDMLDMEVFHIDNSYADWGGIKLCLENPEILKNQFRALLKVSSRRPINIMLPMISNLEEVESAKQIFKAAQNELDAENIHYNNVKLGVMVETKNILKHLDALAQEVAFFSIGTNDLAHFLLGTSRDSDSLTHHYHPVLFKKISRIVETGLRHNIPVTLCGEMGADPYALIGLAAVGIRSISVNTSSLASITNEIENIDLNKMANLESLIYNCEDPETVHSILMEYYEQYIEK